MNTNNSMTGVKGIIPDYHLHSCFSADCDSDPRKIIETAQSNGMRSLCFTDHNDLDFPDTPDNLVFDLDIENYISTLMNLRNELTSFDIRIGVEQGVMPTTCSTLNSYSKEHPGLDFIICSSHVVEGFDPYYSELWLYPDGTVKDKEKIYQTYFEEMLYNVQHFHDYNVYGHMDYVFRYGPENDKRVTKESFAEIYFPKYKELIYEILKSIIYDGKGIEINTGSLYRGMDYAHPHIEILKMYRELGGEILTFGSDAHDLEHIGYGLKAASQMAMDTGFRYYSEFKNMQPQFIKL